MPRNFVATVKEVPGECPFEVHFEISDDIGTGMRTVVVRMQPNFSLEDARALAAMLNGEVRAIGLVDLHWPNESTLQRSGFQHPYALRA